MSSEINLSPSWKSPCLPTVSGLLNRPKWKLIVKFSFQFSKAFLILLWYAFPLWGALALLITLCGCLLALIDGLLIGDGIYFAWITSTTIGYGDLFPVSGASRLLAIIIAFLGMPLNGLIVALAVLAARTAVDKNGRLYSLTQGVEGRSSLGIEDTSDREESEASA